MKRRPLGRDLGVTIRMAVALIPIFAWYLFVLLFLLVLVIGTLVGREWDAFLGAVLFAVGGPVLLWQHIHRSESVALRAARAKELAKDDEPELQALVARVAAMADLSRGGLAVQALCIVGHQAGWRRFELFSDHPPLDKRLERLAELSRELGKAA